MSNSNLDDWFTKLRNIYTQVRILLETVGKPTEELSQKIIGILLQMEHGLQTDCDAKNPNLVLHISVLSALVKYELGRLCFWEYPELAEKYFRGAWDLVSEHRTDPDYVLLAVSILHELNALSIYRQCSPIEIQYYFLMGQTVWISYQVQTAVPALTLGNLFLSKPSREAFRAAPTFDPVYNLHEVFKQNYSETLAVNLLVAAEKMLRDYDEPFIWSGTMFRLADMFISSQRFSSARHILSYVSVLVIQDEVTLRRRRRSKKTDELQKKCARVKTKLDDYWGYYAMFLLSVSRNKKQRREPNSDSSHYTRTMSLPNADEDKIAHFERKIPCTLLSYHEEAMAAFSFGKKHLDRAQSYYFQHGYVEEYTLTIENINNLYENLLYFDTDNERIYKTNKSVISMLLTKLVKFDPTINPEYDQRILFQLTRWYTRALYLKMTSFRYHSVHLDKTELHVLCEDLIRYSIILLDHFPFDEISLHNYGVDDARYVLHACVTLCNAHLVLYTFVDGKKENLHKGEEYGSKVVSYIKKSPHHAPFVRSLLEKLEDSVTIIQNFATSDANKIGKGMPQSLP